MRDVLGISETKSRSKVREERRVCGEGRYCCKGGKEIKPSQEVRREKRGEWRERKTILRFYKGGPAPFFAVD